MKTYRIESPIKLNGEIKKSGTVELDQKAAAPLLKTGSIIEGELIDAQIDGVVLIDGSQVDLDGLKVDELKDLAKNLEVEGYANMKKAELVVAIKAVKVQVEE